MPKYRVTLADGRTTDAYAPDEAGAKSQARHWDRDRFVIAIKRGFEQEPTPSEPVSVEKIKD